MKQSWVFFVARRYFQHQRRDSGNAASRLSVIGIAVGVTALITVLSVMNGFQLGFIEDILEISSYHLRVGVPAGDPDEALMEALRGTEGVTAVLPFREMQTLVKGRFGYEPCLVRAVPPFWLDADPGLAEQLNPLRGSFALDDGRGAVIGSALSYHLGLKPGDEVRLMALSGRGFQSLRPSDLSYTVSGIFRSGYQNYDSGLIFIDWEGSRAIFGSEELIYGIKLEDRYRDREAAALIAPKLAGLAEKEVSSWRDYNRSFFSALRLEKSAMMLMIGLIFLVVGVNIYNSLKRSVMERREEIGVLRSIGAGGREIQRIFLFNGLLIGVTGALVGLVLGLLLSININTLLSWGQSLMISGLRGGGSPFLYRIPVRILFPEVVMILIFAISACLISAYLASRRVRRIKPAQVLRYQ